MTLVLDSGAFVALERNERAMWRRMKAALVAGQPPRTNGGVVAQVWRDGARQARLAQAVRAVDVVALDETIGRAAGVLCGRTGLDDVVDAAVVAVAHDGDTIVTSDRRHVAALVASSGRHVAVIPV